MPSQRIQLETGELYHLSYRAVGDSVIFKDEKDYFRGIFSCYEFNNANPVNIWHRRIQRRKEKIHEKALIANLAGSDPANIPGTILRGPTPQALMDKIIPVRDKFVEVLVFCFMPNHIHFILRQLKENGISLFIQKIGGYTTYFNKKYKRKGHLFNKFKAVHIKSDEQLRMAFIYDHINPISLIEPGWKEKGIKNPGRVIEFLEKEFRWSSFFDYLGENNFPSVTDRNFFLDFMGGAEGCRKAVCDWIYYKKQFEDFDEIAVE